MATFTLRYQDDGLGVEKRIEFEADTPAEALLIAQREVEERWAELSVDGERICELGRQRVGASNYWVIRSGHSRVCRAHSAAPLGVKAESAGSSALEAGDAAAR